MNFNVDTKANLNSSFFGTSAEGVGGVFYGVSDTNQVGSFIGGQKTVLNDNYATAQ